MIIKAYTNKNRADQKKCSIYILTNLPGFEVKCLALL
jgi:hypothetical protein